MLHFLIFVTTTTTTTKTTTTPIDFEDEVPSDMKGMSNIYKAARAALKSALQRLVIVAQKAGVKAGIKRRFSYFLILLFVK